MVYCTGVSFSQVAFFAALFSLLSIQAVHPIVPLLRPISFESAEKQNPKVNNYNTSNNIRFICKVVEYFRSSYSV